MWAHILHNFFLANRTEKWRKNLSILFCKIFTKNGKYSQGIKLCKFSNPEFLTLFAQAFPINNLIEPHSRLHITPTLNIDRTIVTKL